jgi:membrane protein implicated in regulation of membrane protease activity
MATRMSPRWHTVYSIVSTIVEEMAIGAALTWLLPLFDVTVPVWAVVLILVGFAVFSYVMYRVGHPTISYKEVSAPESIIGCQGIVARRLDPEGLVRVCGELWRATSSDAGLAKGDEVIIRGIEGLKLTVSRKQGNE